MSHQSNQIFIRNLDSYTNDKSLESYFQKFGVVKFSKVLRDRNGRSKKCGLITFAKTSSATMALLSKHHLVDGRKVECRPSRSKQSRITDSHRIAKHLRRIYVGNLGSDISGEQLQNHFSKYGRVEYAYVKKDIDEKSKGYGFVSFYDSSTVEEVQKHRPHVINNRTVQTVRSYPDDVPYDDRRPTTMLYVMDYENRLEEADVKKYFLHFGFITSLASRSKIREDSEEEYGRYMELEFKDYDIVDKICLKKNHSIKHCNITVKKYLNENSDDIQNSNISETETEQPERILSLNTATSSLNSPPKCGQTPSAPCFPSLENLHLHSNGSIIKQPETNPSLNVSSFGSKFPQKYSEISPDPCSPPLEDLHNPGINPYHNFHQQPSSLYPSLPGISYPCSAPTQCELDRGLKRSRKKDKNSCIII